MAEAVGACGGGGGASIQNQAPQRRPRVREVSSRFMTPSAAHSSASSLSPVPNQKQRSNSVQRQRSTTPSSYADQNTNDLNRSPPHQQRKPAQPRAVAKLVFKDNRPDTPTLATTTTTRSRQQQFYLSSSSSGGGTNLSAASKLLHSSGLSSSSTCLESAHSVNDNINNQLVRSLQDLRSSAPDAETTRTSSSRTTPAAIVVSSRYLTEKTNSRVPPSSTTTTTTTTTTASSTPTPYSPCSRSLHLPRSTSVGGDRRYYNNNLVKVGLPLPPPPPLPLYTKPASTAADVPKRSGKRVPGGHQEDAHLLKLLHNRCLQWRFLNAKSHAFIHSQSIESERTLYSINIKIEEQRELVTRKCAELSQLQRMRTLSKILEVQMPYLDEWLTLEGDFSVSLSEAIQSLLNVSVQLPVSGNVKADIADVQEALNSSMKLMESMALYVSDLLQKTEQIEILVSELARLSGGERALIEECGDLLSRTYQSQVEEGSLQSQLIQLYRSLHE